MLLTEPAQIAISILRACYFFNVNHLLKTSLPPSGPSNFFQRAFLLNLDIAIRQSFEGGIVSSLNDQQWEITGPPKKCRSFCQRTASKNHRAVYIASRVKKSLCEPSELSENKLNVNELFNGSVKTLLQCMLTLDFLFSNPRNSSFKFQTSLTDQKFGSFLEKRNQATEANTFSHATKYLTALNHLNWACHLMKVLKPFVVKSEFFCTWWLPFVPYF